MYYLINQWDFDLTYPVWILIKRELVHTHLNGVAPVCVNQEDVGFLPGCPVLV